MSRHDPDWLREMQLHYPGPRSGASREMVAGQASLCATARRCKLKRLKSRRLPEGSRSDAVVHGDGFVWMTGGDMARVSRGNGSIPSAGVATVQRENAAVILAMADFATAAMPEQHEPRAPDRPDPAALPENPLRGYIDEANCNRITGWVWDPQRPERRIALELLDGDIRLVTVLADQYRSDLRRAGIGDGRHVFTVPMRQGLLVSARNVLHLRCAETGMQLPGSPVIIERSLVAAAPSQAFNDLDTSYVRPAADALVGDPVGEPTGLAQVADALPADPLGDGNGAVVGAIEVAPVSAIEVAPDNEAALRSNIDFADWTGIRGWIWDPREPQKQTALEFLDGDTALARVVASDYRADLEQAGIGDGRHGFSIALNETLLPFARHVLHLRPVGCKDEIASFPLVLMREHTGLDPSVMQFILGNVVAEGARAQKPEDLSPIITNLVEMVDRTLACYFALGDGKATLNAADLLNPKDVGPQLQAIIASMKLNYPTISIDIDREPLVSIIIPAYNKFDLTYNCIKSIAKQGARVPFEVIIVDDCSNDETILAEFAFGGGVRLIRNGVNVSFIRSCNRGFEAARGKYVVFLNNDTEVKEHWLDELYETMQRDPGIGVVGSKLLFPDGSLQECGGIVWRLGDAWNWGRGQPARDPRFCYMRDADYVSGSLRKFPSPFREISDRMFFYPSVYPAKRAD